MQNKSKPLLIATDVSSSSLSQAVALLSHLGRPCLLPVEKPPESLLSLESREFWEAVEKYLIDLRRDPSLKPEVFECQNPNCGQKICATGEETCKVCGHRLLDEDV